VHLSGVHPSVSLSHPAGYINRLLRSQQAGAQQQMWAVSRGQLTWEAELSLVSTLRRVNPVVIALFHGEHTCESCGHCVVSW